MFFFWVGIFMPFYGFFQAVFIRLFVSIFVRLWARTRDINLIVENISFLRLTTSQISHHFFLLKSINSIFYFSLPFPLFTSIHIQLIIRINNIIQILIILKRSNRLFCILLLAIKLWRIILFENDIIIF